jgi:hypothetical protein
MCKTIKDFPFIFVFSINKKGLMIPKGVGICRKAKDKHVQLPTEKAQNNTMVEQIYTENKTTPTLLKSWVYSEDTDVSCSTRHEHHFI